ncbi:DUF4190 domain-containing protein, partial [Microbacterium gorillae]|uniref:DUF4190 domain-containing protein n=1 Tax=Microbacterium gorillae TaxID=1231063 RepID=UPI00058B8454
MTNAPQDPNTPNYGAPQNYPAAPAPAPGQAAPTGDYPGKTLGLVALIVAIFFNVIGLILGIVAMSQSKKAGFKNPLALWAIIIGAVLTVLGIIIGISSFAAMSAIVQTYPTN